MSDAVSFRLPSAGLVDRNSPVGFQFDGRRYQGLAGDTLASALLANGVRLVGRSFKYHRPRGIFTAGPEEPNALVELRIGTRREPNTKATTIELFDGLEANSQNRWPSLAFDLLSVNQLAGAIFVGGFYYKTFMWPAAFWEKVYEPMIRRAAGLGRASGVPDPDRYEKATAFCDVLVIGAGPAGLMAAREAGRAGARVILCEDDFRLGGRLLAERQEVDGGPAAVFAAEIEAELAAMPQVRTFRRTQVFGSYDGSTYGALERVSDHLPIPEAYQPRQRLWHIVATRCVNAMGAVERPVVFGGNDRPGVMLASAARTYLNRYGVAPGRQAVVFTTGDDGWRTAADLTAAGVVVTAIIDSRQQVAPEVSGWASKIGLRVLLGASVTDAKGGAGGIKAVEILSGRSRETIAADFLAVSGGWNPQLALTTHKGARPRWSDELAAFLPGDLPEGMLVAGAANGDYALGACLRTGMEAGRAAATDCGFSSAAAAPLPVCEDEATSLTPLWHVAQSRSKAFVDQQNDVTAKDIEIAHREGFRSVEHLKRYTTLGMATDQGKTSSVAGHAMMAGLLGRAMTDVGTTVSRPPHLPVAIGALAGPHRGKHFKATRLTAGHELSQAHGATMIEAGQWLRPQWFTKSGEKDWLESVSREVRTTRSTVGICDVSTLGKIDIKGVDAGAFLDRVYVNTFSTVAVGKARYGLMLREDGFVMDDGTSARFAPDHFVMSTTTANAVKVMQHLEFCRQVLWPELDVCLSSITEHWSQYAVAGPGARDLLQRLYGPQIDLSSQAFPYMACGVLPLGNVSSRLYRLSFSGELAYEIAVPAHYGHALLEALMRLAEELGGCGYGTEALGVMRVEKGHVAGNELNGQTTAGDLGLGRMMSTKKDYIGRVLAGRSALVAAGRPALIGIKPVNPVERLRAGAHFLKKGAAAQASNDEGFVTSVVYSPMLESWIGLGLLADGPSRHGEVIRAYDPVRNGDIEVEIVSPVFFDPEGSRLHV